MPKLENILTGLDTFCGIRFSAYAHQRFQYFVKYVNSKGFFRNY